MPTESKLLSPAAEHAQAVTGMTAREMPGDFSFLQCQLGSLAPSEVFTIPPRVCKQSYPVNGQTGPLYHIKHCGKDWSAVLQSWREGKRN